MDVHCAITSFAMDNNELSSTVIHIFFTDYVLTKWCNTQHTMVSACWGGQDSVIGHLPDEAAGSTGLVMTGPC